MGDENESGGGSQVEGQSQGAQADDSPPNIFNLKPGEKPRMVRAQKGPAQGQKRDVPAPQKQQVTKSQAQEQPGEQQTSNQIDSAAGFGGDDDILSELESVSRPEEPEDEVDFEEDPELKDKPGAQKRIRSLLGRAKDAEGALGQIQETVQRYDTAYRELQGQTQQIYQQNQQLREGFVKMQAELEAFRRYGAPQAQQRDEVDVFRDDLLGQVRKEILSPVEKQLRQELNQMRQEREQERSEAKTMERRTRFAGQGSAAAKAITAGLHEPNADMESFLAAQAIALAHGKGISIEAAGQELSKMLDLYTAQRYRFMRSAAKTKANQKMSPSATRASGRTAPGGRSITSNTEAEKAGLGDSLSADLAKFGIQH